MEDRQAFLLRIQRFENRGWFFVACDDVPGLSAFGPDLDDVLERIVSAGTDLMNRRGRRGRFVLARNSETTQAGWESLQQVALQQVTA